VYVPQYVKRSKNDRDRPTVNPANCRNARSQYDEGVEPPAGRPPATWKIDSIARSALRLLCDKNGGYYYPSSGIRRAFELLAQQAGVVSLLDEMRRLATTCREESEMAAAAGHSPFSNEVSDPRRIADELLNLAGHLETHPQRSTPEHPLLVALEAIASCGTWEEAAPCPEPLFQAVPKPRRFPIARYLMRRRRLLACNPDLLILDEAQDYSTQGSAQQKAAHRLVEIPGIPTLALSGSLMGGYAGSLFANFWALSRRFRAAFDRTDKQGFVSRYGYRKIYVPAGKEEKTEIAGYGAQSDREDHSATPEVRQKSEEAPGILPLFLLEHLLPVSLIMHKEDLEGELPPCREIPVPIEVAAIFDPFGNAVHTALSFPVLGEDVLITGAGPIGIMAAAVVRHAGARYVVITDINPHRLQLAQQLGVNVAIDPKKKSLKEVQKDLGMHEGFDVGLEMSGNASAFREMLANMSHGGKVAMLGIPAGEMAIDWRQVIFNMLTIKGIYGREMYETWYKMTVMLESGLDIPPVITHRFPYAEFQKGFDAMRSGSAGKVLLDWRQ